MEANGAYNFSHRQSPSLDRFLDVFSPPKSDSASGTSLAGDELNEAEVFWTVDFNDSSRRSTSPTEEGCQSHRQQSMRQPEKFGILAALSDDNRRPSRPVLCRKPSISSSSTASPSSRVLPAIPKPPPEREYSQSVPMRKFHQSAPIRVPVVARKVRNGELAEVDLDNEEDDEMLPPHEIVARGSAKSPKNTFSVLEGVGRTLKGRDLRQVRNAVWRKTGFLD